MGFELFHIFRNNFSNAFFQILSFNFGWSRFFFCSVKSILKFRSLEVSQKSLEDIGKLKYFKK